MIKQFLIIAAFATMSCGDSKEENKETTEQPAAVQSYGRDDLKKINGSKGNGRGFIKANLFMRSTALGMTVHWNHWDMNGMAKTAANQV